MFERVSLGTDEIEILRGVCALRQVVTMSQTKLPSFPTEFTKQITCAAVRGCQRVVITAGHDGGDDKLVGVVCFTKIRSKDKKAQETSKASAVTLRITHVLRVPMLHQDDKEIKSFKNDCFCEMVKNVALTFKAQPYVGLVNSGARGAQRCDMGVLVSTKNHEAVRVSDSNIFYAAHRIRAALQDGEELTAPYLLAQNQDLTLDVKIRKEIPLVHLCLYSTKEKLDKGKDAPVMAEIVHGVSHLDDMVGVKYPGNGRANQVVGLVAVANELLRRNLLPMYTCNIVRPFASEVYENMSMDERKCLLKAFDLQYEKAGEILGGEVAQWQPRVVVKESLATTNHSNALRHAIAHQNTAISTRLMACASVNFAESTNALLAGVAFCHSIAYDTMPIPGNGSVVCCLINEGDFETHCARELLGGLAKLQLAPDAHWSRVRHNTFAGFKNGCYGVKCHVHDETGVLLFRRDSCPADMCAAFVPASAAARVAKRASPIIASSVLPTREATVRRDSVLREVARLTMQNKNAKGFHAFHSTSMHLMHHMHALAMTSRKTELRRHLEAAVLQTLNARASKMKENGVLDETLWNILCSRNANAVAANPKGFWHMVPLAREDGL